MAQVDPRDMLNNFCFHVYTQKSLFIGENGNVFFDISSTTTRAPDIRDHRAGSQLKMTPVMSTAANFTAAKFLKQKAA